MPPGRCAGAPSGAGALGVGGTCSSRRRRIQPGRGERGRRAALPLRLRGRDAKGHRRHFDHSLALRSLRAFAMTETELRLIAAAAIIGESNRPKIG